MGAERIRRARLAALRAPRLRILRARAAEKRRIWNHLRHMNLRYGRIMAWFARWNRTSRRTFRRRMWWNRVSIGRARGFIVRINARLRAVRIALARTSKVNRRIYYRYIHTLRAQKRTWYARLRVYRIRLAKFTRLERLRLAELRRRARERARRLRIRREKNRIRNWVNWSYRQLYAWR